VLAAGMLVAVVAMSGYLAASRFSLAGCLFLLISLYRGFNLLRIVEARMHERYLLRVTLRTSLALMLSQLILLALWGLSDKLLLTSHQCWIILGVLQLLAAVLVLATTLRQLRLTTPPALSLHLADRDLPSITVCIPARNETAAMEACLRTLVASDYPKLEVLVLDDCSQDKTPDIIKSFAHDGIRFIRGAEPPAGWLAKNWAYQRLAGEASGELLIFAGVDVNFAPAALRALVLSMKQNSRQMLSVVPRNESIPDSRRFSALLQPARYAWELCLPRRRFGRPPVLSSCWAIERRLLEKHGGFAAVASDITPESYFARAASTAAGAYGFVRSAEELDIVSRKPWDEQWSTAVRTRYPQLHRRPEMVLLVSALEALVLLFPFFEILWALARRDWLLLAPAAVAFVLQVWAFAAVVQLTYRKFLWRSLIALLPAAALDIALRHLSMWRYELGAVYWKGRNVCLPVMHVFPHLPTNLSR